jgi:hypothetical protein
MGGMHGKPTLQQKQQQGLHKDQDLVHPQDGEYHKGQRPESLMHSNLLKPQRPADLQ